MQRGVAKAFDRWASRAEPQAQKRIGLTMTKFVRRLANQRLAAGFETWRQAWEEQAVARHRISRVAQNLLNPGLSKAFYRWAEMAENRGSKRRLMRKFLQRHFQGGLSRAWTSWLEYVAPYRVLKRAAAALLHSGVFRAWNAWVDNCGLSRKQSRQREVAVGVLSRLANRELSRAWEAWRELVDARNAAWAVLDRVARRWRVIGASRAWAQWKALAASRMRKRQLMRSFAGRLANMDVARAWSSWVGYCNENRTIGRVLYRYHNQLLTKTFFAWVRSCSRPERAACAAAPELLPTTSSTTVCSPATRRVESPPTCVLCPSLRYLQVRCHRYKHVGFFSRAGQWLAHLLQILPQFPARGGSRHWDDEDDSDEEWGRGGRHGGRHRRVEPYDPYEPPLPAMDGPFGSRGRGYEIGVGGYRRWVEDEAPSAYITVERYPGREDQWMRPSVESRILAHDAARHRRMPHKPAKPDGSWSGDPSSSAWR